MKKPSLCLLCILFLFLPLLGMNKVPCCYHKPQQKWVISGHLSQFDDGPHKNKKVARKFEIEDLRYKDNGDLTFKVAIKYGLHIGPLDIPVPFTGCKLKEHIYYATIGFYKPPQVKTKYSYVNLEQPFDYGSFTLPTDREPKTLTEIIINFQSYSLSRDDIVQIRVYPKYNIAIGVVREVDHKRDLLSLFTQLLYACNNLDTTRYKYTYYFYTMFFRHNILELRNPTKLTFLNDFGPDKIDHYFFNKDGESIIFISNNDIYQMEVMGAISRKYCYFTEGFDVVFKYR